MNAGKDKGKGVIWKFQTAGDMSGNTVERCKTTGNMQNLLTGNDTSAVGSVI